MGQMRPAIEREKFSGLVGPVFDDGADTVGIDHVVNCFIGNGTNWLTD
jgi:hypothetical protein